MKKIYNCLSLILIALATATVPSKSMKRPASDGGSQYPPSKLQEISEEKKQSLINIIEINLQEKLKKSIKENNIEQVRELLAKGISPNSPAICQETIYAFIANEIDVDDVPEHCTPPLSVAVEERNIEIVKLLLDKGADPDKLDAELDAPLHLLAKSKSLSDKDVKIAELLLGHGADPNVADGRDGYTPLNYAEGAPNNQQKYKYVELLLKHGALVKYANLNFFESFIEKLGAQNIDEISSIELAIFKLLARYGGSFPLPPYPQWLSEAAIEIFKKLSERVFKGPLIPAIISNDVERIKELKSTNQLVIKDDMGKGKAITDDEGISALVYAVGQGSQEIIDLLLSYLAYQRDSEGIEQALEIVKARLRGLEPTSPEYQHYQAIYRQLNNVPNLLIDPHTLPASVVFGSVLPGLPPEIWHHILGYLPAATLPVFSFIAKQSNKDK